MPRQWLIQQIFDKESVRQILNQDRVYNAYMLGDLDDQRWRYCQFFTAQDVTTYQHKALVLRYTAFVPNLLVVFGSPKGVDAILSHIVDSSEVYYTATEDLLPILQRYYNTPDAQHMWRMQFDPARWVPRQLPPNIQHLQGTSSSNMVTALFAEAKDAAGVFFSPEQLDEGAFYGVLDENRLVAVSGTHVVSVAESVAAVGNVYTDSAYRKRGYATQCTRATTHQLYKQGIQTIVLNVKQSNQTAIHIYEKLGYIRRMPFWEGPGIPH